MYIQTVLNYSPRCAVVIVDSARIRESTLLRMGPSGSPVWVLSARGAINPRLQWQIPRNKNPHCLDTVSGA